jgi:Domain of unknown function (DUF5667)
VSPLSSVRTPGADAEPAVRTRLADLAGRLDVEPDPGFRTATRARLVAMAAVRPATAVPRRRLRLGRADDRRAPAWRTRLTAGLVGAALTVTACGAVVAAAEKARPGDALYGVKRGTEQTQLTLAGSDRGPALLELAGTRLEEVAALPAGAEPELVAGVLGTMDRQTAAGAAELADRALEGSDPAPVAELATWAERQDARLAEVRAAVPAAASDEVRRSADLLADVLARVAALRAALACPSGPATSGTDRLGPVPLPCPDAAPPTAPVGVPAPAAPAPAQGTAAAPPRATAAGGDPPARTRPRAPAGAGRSPAAGRRGPRSARAAGTGPAHPADPRAPADRHPAAALHPLGAVLSPPSAGVLRAH